MQNSHDFSSRHSTIRDVLEMCVGPNLSGLGENRLQRAQVLGRGGRPTKYSPELAVELCMALLHTMSLSSAASEFNIHRSTVWRWQQRIPEFHRMLQIIWYIRNSPDEDFVSAWGYSIRDQRRVLRRLQHGFFSPVAMTRVRGRPTKYREEHVDAVESSLQTTAQRIGVTKRTVINWTKRYPEFRNSLEWERARVELERHERWLKNRLA